MMVRLFEKLGPLAPVVMLFILCLLIFLINRVLLGWHYAERIIDVKDFFYFIPVGFRTDIIILSMTFAIPTLTLMCFPKGQVLKYFVSIWLILIGICFILLEITSWSFLEQFSSRPNQLFFQYFTHPREVMSMIWVDYKLVLIITFLLLLYFVRYSWLLINRLIESSNQWPLLKRIVILPFVVALLILGSRSGIGEATATPSIAAFSNNYLLNQIALNASYSLSYAIYVAQKPALNASKQFGSMPDDEVLQRVKQYMGINTNKLISNYALTTSNVLLHQQNDIIKQKQPLNLVIILMEGFGAKRSAILGGENLSPRFDELAEQGALFTQLYSIGTRTSRGLEAIVAGFPPSVQGSSIMKQDLAQHNFYTIANIVKKSNYQTSFIYGGESHFDNMSGFFLGNGFDEIIDRNEFSEPEFIGTWGVSDEDLFRKANQKFKSYGEKPFLSVVLTLSNHPPFDFPADKIDLIESPQATDKNASRYADYALGKFFAIARKENYFERTVFLITGDHPISIKSESLVPAHKFQIPGLLIGPNISKQKISIQASQLDLPVTALGTIGIPLTHPFVGRNLLKVSSSVEGRSLMIFGNSFGFRKNNQLVVYQPNKNPVSFSVENKQYQPIANDPELVKDALAHILFPGVVYEQRLYNLVD